MREIVFCSVQFGFLLKTTFNFFCGFEFIFANFSDNQVPSIPFFFGFVVSEK